MPIIINSFMSIGGKTSHLGSLSPGSVFNVGLNIADKMFNISNNPNVHFL